MFKDFDERYAPKSINDIVYGDEMAKMALMDIVEGHNPFPSNGKNGILLYGTPGTGKSALAALLPNAIEAVKTGGLAYERYERVKPGNNGANLIASINNDAMLMPAGSHRYFVLDEVDNLKDMAMASLKSVMNLPCSLFILTTNYFSEIEAGVKSRCHCIPFNAAAPQKWLPLARRILAEAGVAGITDADLINIIAAQDGDARNILEAIKGLALHYQRTHKKPSPQ